MGDSAESARRSREERFRDLAENATELLLELGADGRASYMSRSAEELLGYRPEDMIEPCLLDWVHEDDREQVARDYAPILEREGRAQSVHRVRHADGSLRWFHDTARSYRDADGELRIVVVGRDVTEQRLAEDDLSRQLAAQQQVAELSSQFLALPAAEVEDALRSHLPAAAALAGADRTRLIVMGADDLRALHAYEWAAPGFSTDMGPLTRDVDRLFCWSARQLAGGQVLRVPRVADLPDEAAAERDDMSSRGVRSLLAIPLTSGDSTIGFQVFECLETARGWSDAEVTRVRMVGEIFVRALERRRAEAALRESETRFRAMAENATELVAEFDARGRFLYASPSFDRLLGRRPDELAGRPSAEILHPDDLAASSECFSEALAQGGESHSVHRLRHKDGRWRWFDNSGRAYRGADGELRFVSLGRDITERKTLVDAIERQLSVEKRVAALSRRFLAFSAEEIESSLADALVEAAELAGSDRCYLYLMEPQAGQKPFFEWTGDGIETYRPSGWKPWSRAQIQAGNLILARRPEDLPSAAQLERESLRERGVRSMLHIPIRSGDRTIALFGFEAMREERAWNEHQVTLLRLIGEILTSAVRRARSENALRASQQELSQAQRLEAVGRLAGGVAHDFNNLLTVILGFSRPLLRELADADPVREDLVEIHAAAERAAALTRQLLTFSRRQIVEVSAVDLNAVVEGLEPMLQRLLGDDIELSLELDPSLGCVAGDFHQFGQVIVNLAVNARDAMSNGGSLRIATRAEPLDARHAASLGSPAGAIGVRLSVEDTGCGMEAGVRDQIFDPFFTTKPTGKGTGLGLSIAYSVVEQAGGTIEVEGSVGKGTAFHIRLLQVEAASPGPESGASSVGPRGRGRVLLVEDEPAVRRLTLRLLAGGGYEVLEAADGAEALELVASDEMRIDALVSDAAMPQVGGHELARRLRQRWPALPVLMLSGHSVDPSGESGLVEGARCLAKPFTEKELLEALSDLLFGADAIRG